MSLTYDSELNPDIDTKNNKVSVGDRVTICGLKSAAAIQLNGKCGYIKKITNERAAVVVDGGEGEKAAKKKGKRDKKHKQDKQDKKKIGKDTPPLSTGQAHVYSELHDGVDKSIANRNENNWAITACHFAPGLTRVGSCAFSHAHVLMEVEVPHGVTVIGKFAFAHCKSLKKAKIPNTIAQIQDGAFRYCGSLLHFNMRHTKVHKLTNEVFSDCFSLKSFLIPACLATVSDSCFRGCKALLDKKTMDSDTSVILKVLSEKTEKYLEVQRSLEGPRGGYPASADHPTSTDANTYAFRTLEEIRLEEEEEIAERKRRDASSGTSDSETDDDEEDFDRGGRGEEGAAAAAQSQDLLLPQVTDGEVMTYTHDEAINDIRLGNNGYLTNAELFLKHMNITSIDFPTSPSMVLLRSFKFCVKLREVHLPEGILSLGSECFARCSLLVRVTFPRSLKLIGSNAFNGCTRLEEVDLFQTCVHTIEDNAFSYCDDLSMFKFPQNLNTLEDMLKFGDNVFSNCYKLVSSDTMEKEALNKDIKPMIYDYVKKSTRLYCLAKAKASRSSEVATKKKNKTEEPPPLLLEASSESDEDEDDSDVTSIKLDLNKCGRCYEPLTTHDLLATPAFCSLCQKALLADDDGEEPKLGSNPINDTSIFDASATRLIDYRRSEPSHSFDFRLHEGDSNGTFVRDEGSTNNGSDIFAECFEAATTRGAAGVTLHAQLVDLDDPDIEITPVFFEPWELGGPTSMEIMIRFDDDDGVSADSVMPGRKSTTIFQFSNKDELGFHTDEVTLKATREPKNKQSFISFEVQNGVKTSICSRDSKKNTERLYFDGRERWTHFVLTMSGKTTQIYKNGSLVVTDFEGLEPERRRRSSHVMKANGTTIAYLRTWDRKVTAEEVASMWEPHRERFLIPFSHSWDFRLKSSPLEGHPSLLEEVKDDCGTLMAKFQNGAQRAVRGLTIGDGKFAQIDPFSFGGDMSMELLVRIDVVTAEFPIFSFSHLTPLNGQTALFALSATKIPPHLNSTTSSIDGGA
ncbi:hypothetical protein TrVE_jg6340 [Triparma verrucosa]|uniref:Uncharacterized protein n=1 Tax=Triparma verrucosa TaxID=1606542 RepID=A0A9W7C047_9STRA|nr:hypothetical protein TrVE_jg6340 [Triparma verrucosa]